MHGRHVTYAKLGAKLAQTFSTVRNGRSAVKQLQQLAPLLSHADTKPYLTKGCRVEVKVFGDDVDQVHARHITSACDGCCPHRYPAGRDLSPLDHRYYAKPCNR